MHVHHALAAIHAGIIDVALVTHGEMGWSQRATKGKGNGRGNMMPDPWAPDAQYSMPYGVAGAPSNYSHAMTRHNARYGTTPEDFAHIAVVTREWATLNPRAVMHSKETHPFGGPITVEDVQNSRMISWPLTLLHVCLVTDYGGAILITNPEIARSLPTKPVWIAGAGESMSHSSMLEMGDFTATSAKASAAAAYKMAGMGPEDMEMAMIYDSFTITAGLTAEMLGLAPAGEGFTAVERRRCASRRALCRSTQTAAGFRSTTQGCTVSSSSSRPTGSFPGTAEDGVNGIKGKQTSARSCVVNGTGRQSVDHRERWVLVAD